MFNAADSIATAVGSILAQTAPPCEIVIVDDGSTDESVLVAERLATENSTVRLIRQPNGGPGRARNRGVAESEGEFVAFLDADDYWYPDHLESLLEIIQANQDLKWASTAFEYDYGSYRIPEVYSGPIANGVIASYLQSCRYAVTVLTDTVLMRRRVFEQHRGFRENWRVSEDSDLWYRVGIEHPRLGYFGRVSATYHIRGSGISQTRRRRKESVYYFLRSIEAAIRYADQRAVAGRGDVQTYLNARVNTALKAALNERSVADYRTILQQCRNLGLAPTVHWKTRLYWLGSLWPGGARRLALRAKALLARAGPRLLRRQAGNGPSRSTGAGGP
jgi:glycosyltransferase involved in cell wall biosynthesis